MGEGLKEMQCEAVDRLMLSRSGNQEQVVRVRHDRRLISYLNGQLLVLEKTCVL